MAMAVAPDMVTHHIERGDVTRNYKLKKITTG